MSPKQIATAKRLVTNTIFNIGGTILQSGILFFLMPFLYHQLGEDAYGVWVLIGSVFNYSVMIQMGLSSGVSRYIPIFLAKEDDSGIKRIMSTSLLSYGIMGLLILAITLIIHQNLDAWFTIPSCLVENARILTIVVGCAWALAVFLQPFSAALCGLQRYEIIKALAVGMATVNALLLVILLSHGYGGIVTVGLVFGITMLATRLFEMAFVSKMFGRQLISLKAMDFGLFRKLFTYGASVITYELGVLIICRGSIIVIGIFMLPRDSGKFAIVAAPLMMLSSLVQGGVAAILPAVAELDTRNKTQQVRDVWILAQKFSLVILIPAIAFLIIMGGEFLRLWVGDELAELKSILVILAVGHFLRLTQHASFRVLAGRGKHKVFSRLTIVMAIAVIVLAVIVAKYTQAGLVGIAFSNTIPMVIISGFVLSLYANKQMNTSLADNLKHVWLPAFLACFPTLVLLGVWQYLFPPDCWTHIIAVILVALVMTAVSVWFLGLTKIEKSRILAIVGKSTQGSV